MKFKSIEEHVPVVEIKVPVSVCLDRQDAERWESIKLRLKKVNQRARIADFARKSLCDMLTNLENLLNEHDKKNSIGR